MRGDWIYACLRHSPKKGRWSSPDEWEWDWIGNGMGPFLFLGPVWVCVLSCWLSVSLAFRTALFSGRSRSRKREPCVIAEKESGRAHAQAVRAAGNREGVVGQRPMQMREIDRRGAAAESRKDGRALCVSRDAFFFSAFFCKCFLENIRSGAALGCGFGGAASVAAGLGW